VRNVLTFLFVTMPTWWREVRHAVRSEYLSESWLHERRRLK